MVQTRRWALLGVFAVALFGAPQLQAQDSAAASALFDKGLADMQAGKYASACPALAESYRLDPQAGALFTLADCEAKAYRLATAVARYDEYLALYSRMTPKEQAGQRGRDKLAIKARDALMPQVPLITLKLPASAPPGTKVRRDGVMLNTPALGVPLPVDPGEHVIATQVPGAVEHEQKFTITAGEKKELDLELVLPPNAASSSSAAPTQSAPPPPPVTTTPTATPSTSAPVGPVPGPGAHKGGSSHTGAWIIGGIGLAGIAVGSVMGVMALGKKSTVDKECKDLACSDAGMSAADDGKKFALVSTIGFGVGAAGLATSVILLLASSDSSKQPEARTRLRPIVASQGASGALFGVQGAW